MDSDPVVKAWQKAIMADAQKKLGRPLKDFEKRFIASRAGFIALEMIHDTVKAATKAGLRAYLSSERRD